jgi:predicted AAA+ superfamily ATPase
VPGTKMRSGFMEIKRDSYLEQLKIRKDNGMIKIITGIRRCGKSFLLFVLFKKYLLESGVDHDHIIEIALDGIENEELRDPKKCYRYIKDAMKDEQKYYLLLDEVQFMPRFEEVLNSLLRIGNIDVYVTGSNSKFLSSDIVTEFRGRGDEIRIYPLSFAEFYAVFDGDFDDAWEEYMIYGGLPQVVKFSVERQKAEYLKNIFNNVYIKDVVERNRIQNVDEINTLVDILASVIGAPTNPTKISNTFKSERGINYSNKTISNHIDYLAEAFLISKAERYDIKGRKYVGANRKYYFSDIGLRNARLNFRQQEPTHIMENIVYNELLIRGYNVDVGIVDVFEKSSEGKKVHKQLEVDFVVNQGSQRYYIQVAYDMTSEEKQTQELNSLRNIPDSFKKLVIVNGTKKPWRNEEGFVIMGMKYFLLNADSLEF